MDFVGNAEAGDDTRAVSLRKLGAFMALLWLGK